MKKHLCFLTVCLLLASPAFAQSTADEIEALLNTQAVTYGQAARFVLRAANVTVPTDGVRTFGNIRFEYALRQNWLPKNVSENQTARLDAIALLVMCSFEIKGGLLYSFFKTPHYAYRELVYQEIIFGRIDPAMAVSGDDLLYIINRLFSRMEDDNDGLESPEPVDEQAVHLAMEEALAEEINIELEAHHITDAHASVTSEGVMISISNVQFLPDSALLTETERERLHEIAQILEFVPGRKILIAGHTALAGSEESQISLSLERAQAVADYLIFLSVREPGEITTAGYGATRPIADNTTEEGMAANRRVEITILDY